MCYWGEGLGPWAAVGWAAMLALLAGVVLFGVWVLSRSARHSREENGAWAIARERYARGEISRDEFERIKKDLS
ncbi:MAG: SHOCT domain-containing protein [Dehalococcoidia bacterium]|nr:SHOCT domain-containing protein [Dehalococcoidia bacterium]